MLCLFPEERIAEIDALIEKLQDTLMLETGTGDDDVIVSALIGLTFICMEKKLSGCSHQDFIRQYGEILWSLIETYAPRH